MKQLIKITVVLCLMTGQVFAQKYLTKTGKISFYSDASLEKIEAHNSQVNVAYDVATTDIVFKVLIKSFIFEKALMQEHFNENYMESDKFPSSTFKGKILNAADINFNKDGSYKATVQGDLMIHGITKNIKETGTIEVKGSKIIISAQFNVLLKDYGIKIPGNVVNNISENILIKVNATLDKVN